MTEKARILPYLSFSRAWLPRAKNPDLFPIDPVERKSTLSQAGDN